MPTYVYACDICEEIFEVKRPYEDSDEDTYCEVCGANGRKLFSAPYIIWGQGFTKPMDWGKKDDIIVSTRSGINRRSYNDVHVK